MNSTTKNDLASKENFTTAEAAKYLSLSAEYLRELRMTRARRNRMEPPPYVRLSARKVLYRRADLDAWLARHVVGGATEATGGAAV